MSNLWNPEAYERFKAQRDQPFHDLVAMIGPVGGKVVDLGCGTGELTRELHGIVRAKSTLGLDNSESMLAKSAKFRAAGLRFELGTIEDFAADGEYDLVFSNAALHWVPDHATLFPRLFAAVKPGGQFAVHMPSNHEHPSQTVAAAVALEAPFAEATGGFARVSPVQAPEFYAKLLYNAGFEDAHVRLQVYGHELPNLDAVVEWVKSSLLTDYQKRMPEELWPAYLARYRAALADAMGDSRPVFFTFRRLLISAIRPLTPAKPAKR